MGELARRREHRVLQQRLEDRRLAGALDKELALLQHELYLAVACRARGHHLDGLRGQFRLGEAPQRREDVFGEQPHRCAGVQRVRGQLVLLQEAGAANRLCDRDQEVARLLVDRRARFEDNAMVRAYPHRLARVATILPQL